MSVSGICTMIQEIIYFIILTGVLTINNYYMFLKYAVPLRPGHKYMYMELILHIPTIEHIFVK